MTNEMKVLRRLALLAAGFMIWLTPHNALAVACDINDPDDKFSDCLRVNYKNQEYVDAILEDGEKATDGGSIAKVRVDGDFSTWANFTPVIEVKLFQAAIGSESGDGGPHCKQALDSTVATDQLNVYFYKDHLDFWMTSDNPPQADEHQQLDFLPKSFGYPSGACGKSFDVTKIIFSQVQPKKPPLEGFRVFMQSDSPEPSTLLLFGTTLPAIGVMVLRRRRMSGNHG